MAQSLQHDPTALVLELSTAGTADVCTSDALSGSDRSNAVVSIPLVQNIHQVTVDHRLAVIEKDVPAVTLH